MSKPFYSLATFDPQRSIGYLIKRVAKLSTGQIEAKFQGRDLTLSHWITLAMVKHGIGDTCAKLARHLGHDSGAMTRLVDQLEARGLLRRRRCPNDRRVVVIDATPSGDAQFEALTPVLLGVWNRALADFKAEEAETLIGLLSRLVASFEAIDAAEGAAA